VNLFGFFPGYETYIYGGHREPAFRMLVAFILTLAGTRAYTRVARARGWGSVHVGDVHVHHLVPGPVMSLVAGGLAVVLDARELWIAFLAMVFGAGAALVLDEFAMLLHLDDVYWTEEGRLSIDACMAAVAFLGLAILATFPLPTDTTTERLGRALGDGLIALTACLVVVTLLKGKLKLGLLGIVFVPLSYVGALRLAKPSSPPAQPSCSAGRMLPTSCGSSRVRRRLSATSTTTRCRNSKRPIRSRPGVSRSRARGSFRELRRRCPRIPRRRSP